MNGNVTDTSSTENGETNSRRHHKHVHFTLLTDEQAQQRLEMIRRYVGKPIPRSENWADPDPAWVEGSQILIGNKYHASKVDDLVRRGVTAVLNCASGGITSLPMDELQARGIKYQFTNVRQDDVAYPILFDHITGQPSQHLEVAKSVYSQVREAGGRIMFFCVAGQNRYVFWYYSKKNCMRQRSRTTLTCRSFFFLDRQLSLSLSQCCLDIPSRKYYKICRKQDLLF